MTQQRTTTPEAQAGSPARSVIGWMCLVASLVTLPAGFVLMVRALERGGYGTSSVNVSLYVLGAGGGLLGFGIALLIWEYSVRHNIRH